jgi:hypothetical protein
LAIVACSSGIAIQCLDENDFQKTSSHCWGRAKSFLVISSFAMRCEHQRHQIKFFIALLSADSGFAMG